MKIAKNRSLEFVGAMFCVEGVNCVNDQWYDIVYCVQVLASATSCCWSHVIS